MTEPARPRAFVSVFVANLVAVLLVWWMGAPSHWSGGVASVVNDAGRLTGLVGTYLVLVQLILRTHVPWLEAAFGKDALRWAHTRNAYLAVGLLLAHGLLQTIGYALDDRIDPVAEIANLAAHYEGVLIAIVGMLGLVALTALSIDLVRNRMPWPTWRVVHLFMYVAVALSIPHQFATGESLLGSPIAITYWWSLHVAVLVTLLATRTPQLARAAVQRPRTVVPAVLATAFGVYLLASVKVAPAGVDSLASATPSTRPAGAQPSPAASPTPAASRAIVAPATGLFLGDVVATPYGDTQVQILVSDGHLADVQALLLPRVRKVSKQMSAGIEPYLRGRAIEAQSATFDVISGATYTSRAYMESLESALRAAGLGD